MLKLKLLTFLVSAAIAFGVPVKASDTINQEELVSKATFTLKRLATSEKLKAAQHLLKKARAVMVFPNLYKGALFIGGEGGSGVLSARKADGTWSHPAFYTLGSVSFGFQVGGQSSEAILIVMNDKALNALMEDQVKVGGDISAAAGPVGTGIEAASTTSLGEDIYTYSTNKGLFIGASFEGAVIARREDWNGDFYNDVTSPKDIVLGGKGTNAAASPLLDELNKYQE